MTDWESHQRQGSKCKQDTKPAVQFMSPHINSLERTGNIDAHWGYGMRLAFLWCCVNGRYLQLDTCRVLHDLLQGVCSERHNVGISCVTSHTQAVTAGSDSYQCMDSKQTGTKALEQASAICLRPGMAGQVADPPS